ncbi:cbb3-type cytochrome c oxidase N-terminal domain-containing protein [Candidatus Zixiibacteriota bacterium]
MNNEQDKLLDHDYDGIKELDNDLPRWWVYLFWITIIWGVLYMLYYHVFNIGYLQDDEYKSEMDINYVRGSETDSKFLGVLESYHSPFYEPAGDVTPRMKLLGEGFEAYVEISAESDTTTYVLLTEAAEVLKGKDIYIKNCLQCHGAAGQGGIGPNLTDNYWIHDGNFNSVVKSIKYGYPAKGMIAWRTFLSEEKIIQVGSFVNTLKGTNPPNAKPPQGELYEE